MSTPRPDGSLPSMSILIKGDPEDIERIVRILAGEGGSITGRMHPPSAPAAPVRHLRAIHDPEPTLPGLTGGGDPR